jgi:hypothetical protein
MQKRVFSIYSFLFIRVVPFLEFTAEGTFLEYIDL